MSHPNDDTRSAASAAGKPTLEALLRLKRSERPDPAFWEEFDRGLRQKQLAAIIEPKPWWLGLALWGRRLAPAGLPVSAGAAALLALMVLRTGTPVPVATQPLERGGLAQNDDRVHSGARPVGAERSDDSVRVAFANSGAADVERVADGHSDNTRSVATIASTSTTPSAAVPSSSVPAPTAASPVSVVETLLDIAVAPPAPISSQRAVTEDLAVAHAEEPVLAATAFAPPSAEISSALSNEGVIEPAALKMEVRNPRHARVLLAMADNPEVETASGIAHLRDRMARSLDADDALSGSASRLGVGGDRLSVSF